MKKAIPVMAGLLAVALCVLWLARMERPERLEAAQLPASEEALPLRSDALESTRANSTRTGPRIRHPAATTNPSAPHPDSPAPDDFRLLLEEARKNPELAYEVALEFYTCHGQALMAASGETATTLDALCQSLVSDEFRHEFIRLLQYAADSGRIEAQIHYAEMAGVDIELRMQGFSGQQDILRDPNILIDYKNRSIAYLQQAAQRGNPDALARLAYAHEDGILVQRDPATAYAYAHAAHLARQASAGGSTANSLHLRYLEHLGQNLSPDAIDAARRNGEIIYSACCKK